MNLNHILFITCFVLFCIACKSTGKSTAAGMYEQQGYRLVWADEFNKDGRPDISNWKHEKGFVRNEEDQWYQENNAWCENGNLIIEARKENKINPLYQAGSTDWKTRRPEILFTSSSINTAGHKSWLYGRFEMRGKINVSSGLWPAWWTLGTAGRWPANGEIDIMEYYRNMILANIACLGQNGKPEWFTVTKPVDSLGGKAWAAKFHTWRMDWDENMIALFLDDVLINQVPMSKLLNKDGAGVNPFKQPHYMLLNLAIGGMNGGSIDSTAFPNRFQVDYVRVYQK